MITRIQLVSALAAAAAVLPSTGAASVDVQSFRPSAGTRTTIVEDATGIGAPQAWLFSVTHTYVNDPLVETSADRTGPSDPIVDGLHTLEISGGWAASERVGLFAGAPLNLVHRTGHSREFALGDLRLEGKCRFTRDDAPVSLAVVPELHLPTGDRDLFVSDGSVGFGLKVAAEKDYGKFRVVANIGYFRAADARYRDLNYSQKLPLGLAFFMPLNDRWALDTEATGALTIPFNRDNNPSELYAGARYELSKGAWLLGGIALGSVVGNGAGDYRTILGLRFIPVD